MTLKQIKTFLVMAETCHFSKTAEILGTNQPHITRDIKVLEAELGCTLFDRNRRNCKLSDAGKKWHKRFKKVVRIIEEGME